MASLARQTGPKLANRVRDAVEALRSVSGLPEADRGTISESLAEVLPHSNSPIPDAISIGGALARFADGDVELPLESLCGRSSP